MGYRSMTNAIHHRDIAMEWPSAVDWMRRARKAMLVSVASLSLFGCAGTGLETLGLSEPEKSASQSADTLGTGAVKIALILPLSSANGEVAAQSLRNAAELALDDFSGGKDGAQGIQILIKDDRGTPEGAKQASEEAIAAGAELILGPLFGPNVQATANVARNAGRPVIAFSSDAGVAQRGVFLLSFLPQSDVERVISFAGSRGKKSFAALLPQSAYGGVVEAEFMTSANQAGRRVSVVERFQPGSKASLDQAVARLKTGLGQSDTLFIGEGADGIEAVMQALSNAGINGKQVQIVSTGIWNDPKVQALPSLDGAWFAAPDNTRFNTLAGRYQQRFGTAPTRIATLSYDAVTLAGALTQSYGSQRFTDATLTNPNGFSGQDGVFRFRANGLNDRGIAVFEIRSGKPRTISAAPTAFVGN